MHGRNLVAFTSLSLGFVFGEVSKIKAGFLRRFRHPIRVKSGS